jgi:glycosyltransferase involved in cell wall biosynthesis
MKIRIAHFVGSLHVGGAERQVVSLLNSLNPEKFDKHLILLNHKNQGFENQLSSDIKLFSLGYRRRNFILTYLKLISYLKFNKIIILHSHMYHANVPAAIAGRFARIPVILTTEHGKNMWKKWHHHLIERILINQIVLKRIAVSEDIRSLRIKFDHVAPHKIICIPNGTHIPNYKADLSESPKIMGSLGRLVPAKSYQTLIKALKHLRDSCYDMQLLIAGEGPERPYLERYIKELDLSQHVKLLGVRNAEKFLKEIDIFSMSSVREGIPVALLEAMAHGLPVVVTNVGGVSEVIEDGMDGLLCPPSQPKALAENITKIIDDHALRTKLGTNAIQKIHDKYSINKIVSQYEFLYQSLLSDINMDNI